MDKYVSILIDTGANITILSTKLLNSWDPSSRPEIEPVKMNLLTATGESSPFYGKTKLQLEIGKRSYENEFLLTDIKDNGILGMDFLTKYKCDLMLSKGYILLNKERIPCITGQSDKQNICCRISTQENIIIPPKSEMIISGKIIDGIQMDASGIVEQNKSFVDKSGVLVTKAVIDLNNGVIPIRMININTEPYKIHKNTVLAMFETVDNIEIKDEQVRISKVGDQIDSGSVIPEHLSGLIEESSKNLSDEQRSMLQDLLSKHKNVFSRSSDDIGNTKLVEHHIDTGDAKPIKLRPYRIPLSKRLEAENEIKKMSAAGIIEPSSSCWCAPIVMVTKKDGSIRFCCDFRKINSVTIKDCQPLPRIDDSLAALSGCRWLSTADLKSGYWQVNLAEEDKHKTGFAIEGGGFWQFKVMPFGLCNSGATFERLMEKVLAGLSWKLCILYLDDIIIFSRTFSQHLDHLDQILNRLSEANLKLSPNKCHFLRKEVTFLGHTVSEKGIATDEEKIKAVKDWPIPKNVKQVRSFVGLCSYYRKFVPKFASIAKPLHKLTELNTKFIWDEKCQKSFDTLKQALISSPILAFPTEEGRFIIDADASLAGMGSVLSQVQDGVEKVVSYYSKTFSKPERQYCVTRKELLAVVSSIKNFHHYLYGRHFLVRSDHGALRWLINFKNPEGQIARWLEVLGTYDFEIQHRAGRIHSNVDALSRRHSLPTSCTYCSRAENKYENKEVAKNDIEKDMCSEDHSVRLIMKQSVLKNSGLSNDENVDVLRTSQEAKSEVHLYRSSFSDNRFRQEGATEAGLRSSR